MAIWNWTKIRQMVRDLTGKKSTAQLATADLDNYLNHYYTIVLPYELSLQHFEDTWSDTTVVGDDTYPVSSSYIFLRPPLTVDGYDIILWEDPAGFYDKWPEYDTPYDNALPTDALFWQRTLLLRPPPDAAYTIKAPSFKVPTAYTDPSGNPQQDAWCFLIAIGAAMYILSLDGDLAQIAEIKPMYDNQVALVQAPKLRGFTFRRSAPSW